MIRCAILIPFVQFVQFHPWVFHGGMLQPATLLKVSLLHGCFSRILNCINGTKSRNASQMIQIFHGFANFNLLKLFNSFLANVRIFYPLKTAEKQEFFLCFQEVCNENIGQKWVREVWDKSLRDTSQLLYILSRLKSNKYKIGDHSFSTYAKFSEKLIFLTPWYAHVRVRIRG